MRIPKLIGVIGSGVCEADIASIAYDVGKGIAEAGLGLICGGLGGVMEQACKGACEGGGLTVGILPGESPSGANPFVQVRIPTGMGIARNAIVVRSSEVLIAISGGAGTLSEISFGIQLGVPILSLKSFEVFPDIIKVESAEQAVTKAVEYAK